ncbi:FkbM family methyltransferase [bacterium]|nr:FkbM family methyltransferase [bacterium]
MWDVFHFGYHLPSKNLVSCKTIVSLGANAGFTTANFGYLFPEARILAVELDAENVSLCRKNTSHLGDRCRVEHAGVWYHDGELKYGGENVHEFSINRHEKQNQDSLAAPAITIKSLFDAHSINHVDYLKMDIEGAEAEIFDAELDWVEKVSAINLELHPPAEREHCRKKLEDVGFVCEDHSSHPNSIFAYRVGAACTET